METAIRVQILGNVVCASHRSNTLGKGMNSAVPLPSYEKIVGQIGLECSPIPRETWVQSQVESYQRLKKWYLMPPCLTLRNIRYGSRVKWSNPGKGVAPFPTPRCCSYQKGTSRSPVVYWPPTRPSCQKKKCTCVNNRCIRSKISGDQGRPWLSRGSIECEIVTLAGRIVDVKLLYNPGDRKFRSVGEKMLEWGPCSREAGLLGPRLNSSGERERNAVIAIRVVVNMLQFCSVSNSPLTQ